MEIDDPKSVRDTWIYMIFKIPVNHRLSTIQLNSIVELFNVALLVSCSNLAVVLSPRFCCRPNTVNRVPR
jgi:hypothetical protein